MSTKNYSHNVKDEERSVAEFPPSVCSIYSDYAETQLEQDIKSVLSELSKFGMNKIRVVDKAASLTEEEYQKEKATIASQCNIPEGRVIVGKRDIPPRLHQYYEFVPYLHQSKETDPYESLQ